ncbi:MAG: hypothetical protein KGI05_04600 [Thaumarchaeota archaeon]|nr:hypothetical protein [Nitrososphaerota archaeon]
MSIGTYTITTRAVGTVLTATIYNTDHQNHVNNQNPQGTGAYSDNVAQMQATRNPGGVGSEVLASSLADELGSLRYMLLKALQHQDGTAAQWYATPEVVTNNTGNTVAAGDVVIIDTTSKAVNQTTVPSYNGAVGVVLVGGANGASIEVVYRGVQTVAVDGATTIGHYLVTSGTARKAHDSGVATGVAAPQGTFAVALTSSGGAGTVTALLFNALTVTTPSVLRGFIDGLIMSTAGSSSTGTVAAGQCADSGNTTYITLSSSISKTTAGWVVGSGNGGLDTGAIAPSTWYHWYVIAKSDLSVVDVVFSLSASAPTMPATYTYKRRIGSMKTDGSSNWTKFTQDGDYFRWAASVLDVNTINPGTAAVTITVTSPPGVTTEVMQNILLITGATAVSQLIVSDLAANDEAPGTAATPLGSIVATALNSAVSAPCQTRTNTSSQMRYRISYSDAGTVVRIATLGFRDQRGKNA